jgi:acyl carrier protein
MKPYEQTIFAVLREIASQRNPELPPLERGQTLTYDLGLRSLDLAQLVATLELELQADPFARLVPITSVRTVGDVCDAYRVHFEGAPKPAPHAAADVGDRASIRQRTGEPSTAERRRQARARESA